MRLGDGETRPGKYNMALVRRAIRGGWGVPEDVKKDLVDQMAVVLRDGDTEVRDKIGAAKVLILADASDLRLEIADMARGKEPQQVNVAVQVNNQVGDLKGIATDELVRIHRQSLGISLSDQDDAASETGDGGLPS